MKFTSFAIAVGLTAAAAAALFAGRERSEIVRLQKELQLVQTQHNQNSDLAAANGRLSNLLEKSKRSQEQLNEPTHELLRLRGEVGRLRHELEDLQLEKDETDRQRGQALQPAPFPALHEFLGVDSNIIPMLDLRTKRSDVLGELSRVGARLLREEEDYIYAEVVPAGGMSSNRQPARITMEFYFKDGELDQQRTCPKYEQAGTP
jgi:beta-glucosidase-like glycosyl hydrolase